MTQRFFNLEVLKTALRDEHPDYSEDRLDFEARRLRRELHRLEKAWQRSQQRFQRYQLFGDNPFENSLE